MEIIQRHIAIRINYLENEINRLPKVSIIKRTYCNRTATKARAIKDGQVLCTVDTSKPEGRELLMIRDTREKYLAELNSLRSYWHAKWLAPVPVLVNKYVPSKSGHSVRAPLLSLENYLKAEAYSNTAYPLVNGIMLDGKLYRSKGEIKVAGNLSALWLEFKYETKLYAGGHSMFPDFFARSRELDNCTYVEYCGMLDDPNYYNQYIMKRQLYHNMGLREGIDVVFINEYKDHNISDETIQSFILNALEFDAEFDEQRSVIRTKL